MIRTREYTPLDRNAVEKIHDAARKIELKLAGLEEAFLPFSIAAKREDFFEYPGIFVAERKGAVAGFGACTEEELAWLYVDPAHMRKGIGKALAEHMFSVFPDICYIEVLAGNEPAKALYESLGFRLTGIETGRMPGNEAFPVEVCILERNYLI